MGHVIHKHRRVGVVIVFPQPLQRKSAEEIPLLVNGDFFHSLVVYFLDIMFCSPPFTSMCLSVCSTRRMLTSDEKLVFLWKLFIASATILNTFPLSQVPPRKYVAESGMDGALVECLNCMPFRGRTITQIGREYANSCAVSRSFSLGKEKVVDVYLSGKGN